MKKTIPLLLALALCLSACAANVTTTIIKRNADGSTTISSGKDVTIGKLVLDDGPVHLRVDEYSSAANTDVVKAQGKREVDTINAISDATLKALQAGAGMAAKGVGVP